MEQERRFLGLGLGLGLVLQEVVQGSNSQSSLRLRGIKYL